MTLKFIKCLFLFFMSLIYMLIGLWALVSPIRELLPISLVSFEGAIGLEVVSVIGSSEIAGLYGGINLVLGLMMAIGIFNRVLGTISLLILTFLTGSIAFGRFIACLLLGQPEFLNSFFVFECVVFGLGIFFIYQADLLSDIIASKK